eukprot:7070263-Alexandrium_andersonii.AAC.1
METWTTYFLKQCKSTATELKKHVELLEKAKGREAAKQQVKQEKEALAKQQAENKERAAAALAAAKQVSPLPPVFKAMQCTPIHTILDFEA